MYRNVKEYEIKFTDADAYDNLKLSSLLSFLEESACASADELGFGYDDISPRGMGFILVNCYIEFKRNIKLGEKLTVHTWPIKPKHLIFLRDSELYIGNEKVGAVTARWCMIDVGSFTVLPASAYFKESDFENYNTERSIEFTNWKIPAADDAEFVYSKRVAYSDYDHYFHVNNTKYADFLMDVFSVEELENKRVESMQITYTKQCKQGEVIDFYRKCDGQYFVIEGRVNGEQRVIMRVKFNAV